MLRSECCRCERKWRSEEVEKGREGRDGGELKENKQNANGRDRRDEANSDGAGAISADGNESAASNVDLTEKSLQASSWMRQRKSKKKRKKKKKKKKMMMMNAKRIVALENFFKQTCLNEKIANPEEYERKKEEKMFNGTFSNGGDMEELKKMGNSLLSSRRDGEGRRSDLTFGGLSSS
ncbi:uncharacterized protein MONOS_12837 [Monocercomonoides exilis]|uniref:uncharacterized protein n=1 Tax=Monocercomonoides exilis TaxID=2049356 RepID=UPI0035595C99|nr:hypothetical protein MONOS_12837 [Monocercomonoides exilis]|eukprot:MONOS_12837.1-p1 / transcript=MONOS_12837.1 / gene=MONOS_12837 / organism=Monocercomonoides_exilis_PA203 / gene_product=unspecified product / transcript_product=unspecified product / location=Mono_scaffold00740:23481-24090(+) / protein_length=179 / sequence_SO=supercontig / SO=protein_coding / is_pseudo=false